MVWLLEGVFIHFDTIHERDGQTDGRTDRHRMTAKAALATSRGNNGRVQTDRPIGIAELRSV